MTIPSKFIERRPYSAPATAARKLLEIARELPADKGRICVGKWNSLFLAAGGSVGEYAAGRDLLVADGVAEMHECGGFVMLLAPGPDPGDLDGRQNRC